MFTSLVPRIAGGDEPPDASRHRLGRRRLGAVLAVVSALAMGFAMMSAPQPAEALTSIDGQWTVVHGGTGQISLNTDGTYTSTCEVYPNYDDAWCPPAPSGTFQYSTQSVASVTFNGADGSTNSFRASGLVSSPDTITSMFGSTTYSPLVMKRGTKFVCTVWGDNAYRMKGSPLVTVEQGAHGDILYATGSHDLLGPAIADNTVDLAETAPNYFQNGGCDGPDPELTMASFIHIETLVDASVSYSTATWVPQATVTVRDLAEAPASGATVGATFSDAAGTELLRTSCVTAADGTCTLTGPTVDGSITSTQLGVSSVTKAGSRFIQLYSSDPEAPSVRSLTLDEPSTLTPPPTTTTHHVGDLDNTTDTAASSKKWQPQVTVTVLDPSGAVVAGATVSGTFSGHNGTLTCTTAANGICVLGNFTLNRSASSTVFTVTDIVKESSTYQPTANRDPDGDSDGTSITVNRP
jgi:hypothetical protein